MQIATDAGKGRSAGSRMTLSGRVLGWRLSVDEVVTERDPPRRKVWETIGIPRLLVIGAYRMGFEAVDQRNACALRVFVDYDLPDGTWTRLLGRLVGGHYARWCVAQMTDDAIEHFRMGPAHSPLVVR